jgi:uncharacterized 2Fe-2S/4Fe-4S cluster protein (DUF4445 family)
MTSIVRTIKVQAPKPSLQDNTADLDRLLKVITPLVAGAKVVVPYCRLAKVAQRFRKADFTGAVIVNDMPGRLEVVDFLSDLPDKLPAMALDLGTTCLEASLVDLLTGKELARDTLENSQIHYGSDILSRMHYAAKGDGLKELHETILADINELAQRLAEKVALDTQEIRALSVSGNTTMVHFFLGLDPYHLCREPYIPMVNAPGPFQASESGITIHSAAPVLVFPGVASYFGGDLISGILACGLDKAEETSMFIDVGTNAEVVIGNKEWLIACAGAAGPALEGGVARMGMRAGPGAIEHVDVNPEDGRLQCKTIDGSMPKGLCGSGIIDLVAGLYLSRLIDIRGKFRIEQAKERFVKSADGYAFIVAAAEEAVDGKAVLLGQVDLDALMRSKAAMYSILTTLINQVGLTFQDLHRIYVAGAFGQHIDPGKAITLGMLPDLPLDTYVPVGNSSLAGARQILVDCEARKRCRQVVKKTTYIELNVNQEFMIRFSGARIIPHTDHTLFPSVPLFNDA